MGAIEGLGGSSEGLQGAIEDAQRVALVIQYIGTHFRGWQTQPNGRTVQEELETALKMVLGYRVPVHGSGRTDSGVHAAAQVAHFDAPSHVPPYRWSSILNSRLPEDIVVRASASVPSTWHARFSAIYRRYRYIIYTDSRPNLFVKPFTWHYYRSPLNVQLMHQALQPLLGSHDLTAFRRSGSNRPHSWVEMHDVECVREGTFVRIELQASGFLYGMVRLIVGLLVDVGRGVLSPEAFTELWQNQQRDRVRYAAPPQGLCLLRVAYPDFPFPQKIWYNSQPLFMLSQEELDSGFA